MLRIFKYTIAITDEQVVELPKGAKILTIAKQNNYIRLWAEVDPDAEKEDVTILCFGTGHPISEDIEKEFISTLILESRGLVFHFFKKKNLS